MTFVEVVPDRKDVAVRLKGDKKCGSDPRSWRGRGDVAKPAEAVRMDEVLRLRNAIAAGKYRISAEQLAEKLLTVLWGRRN